MLPLQPVFYLKTRKGVIMPVILCLWALPIIVRLLNITTQERAFTFQWIYFEPLYNHINGYQVVLIPVYLIHNGFKARYPGAKPGNGAKTYIMPKYCVSVSWKYYGSIEIEAASPKEAAQKAIDMDGLPDGEYAGDSFEVDDVSLIKENEGK